MCGLFREFAFFVVLASACVQSLTLPLVMEMPLRLAILCALTGLFEQNEDEVCLLSNVLMRLRLFESFTTTFSSLQEDVWETSQGSATDDLSCSALRSKLLCISEMLISSQCRFPTFFGFALEAIFWREQFLSFVAADSGVSVMLTLI